MRRSRSRRSPCRLPSSTGSRRAWGFYGHRLALYRRTAPHAGFGLLRAWAADKPCGAFTFTSNVDGQFQRAGFDGERVCEIHGSIHHLQCAGPCGDRLWPADGFEPEVDEEVCELVNEPPRCPACGGIARPNILLFGDPDWIEARTTNQRQRLDEWMAGAWRLVVIELGAGTEIPTVRRFPETSGAVLHSHQPARAADGRHTRHRHCQRRTGCAAGY